MYPKQHKQDDMEENPYQMGDKVDENLDHQILNRGVPM